MPSNIGVTSNINRQFNAQRFRDVYTDGEDRLELPELQQRNYLFNWQYAVNYNLTKSLRLNLTGSNNNIVRNYLNEDEPLESTDRINNELGMWDGFFDVGEPNRHSQQMQLNYDVPFSKIPALDFISTQYSYTSNFDWQRGGDALFEVAGEYINTVQNANTHTITSSIP